MPDSGTTCVRAEICLTNKGCQGNLQGGGGRLQGHPRCISPKLLRRPRVSGGQACSLLPRKFSRRRGHCELILTPSVRPCHPTHTGSHSHRSQVPYLDPWDPGKHALSLTIKTNFGSHRNQLSEISQLQVSQFNSLEAKPTVSLRFHSTPLHLLFTSASSFSSHTAFYLRVRHGNGLIMFLGVPASCLPWRRISICVQPGWEGSPRPGPARTWVFMASAVPTARWSWLISSATEIKQPEIKLLCP